MASQKYWLSGFLTENCEGVVFNHRKMFAEIFEDLKGKELIITIEKLYNRRSNKQNAYLHGVIIPCIQNHFKDTQGETVSKEGVKAYIYSTVLGQEWIVEEILGKETFSLNGKRFSNMSTVEFNEAKDTVQKYFAEQGCDIPDPRGRNLLNDYL